MRVTGQTGLSENVLKGLHAGAMRRLIDPRLGYRTGRVKDTQALAPKAISRGRFLADLGVRIGEDEADVEVRILLANEPVLDPVFGHEAAFLTSLGGEKSARCVSSRGGAGVSEVRAIGCP